MARPNRNRGRGNRRDTRFNQRAQTNVELQDQSQVNLLQPQLQDAQRDYMRMGQAAQSIGEGTSDLLRETPRPQFDRIGEQYNAGMGSVAPMFAGVEGMPGTEAAAGNALGLASGDAAHTMLANLDAREGLWRSSTGRQNALATEYRQDNVLQRMEDAVRGYNDQLGQVRADDPWQISQEVQTLRDQALQERLARSKMESDAAFNKWLQGYLGGVGGNDRPDNTRANDKNSNGGGGVPGPNYTGPTASGGMSSPETGTISHAAIDNAGATDPTQWRRQAVQDTRQAQGVYDLPGWVRYAFNREGAQSLQDPQRARLYRRKLRPILSQPRFNPAEVPPDASYNINPYGI